MTPDINLKFRVGARLSRDIELDNGFVARGSKATSVTAIRDSEDLVRKSRDIIKQCRQQSKDTK